MSLLQNQPLDVILSIAEHLDHLDRKNLRLVSRSLCNTITRRVFRAVKINCKQLDRPWEDVAGRLNDFKDPALVKTLSQHAQHLSISSHSYCFQIYSYNYVPEETVDIVCEGLRQFQAVKSLSLQWIIGDNAPRETITIVEQFSDKVACSLLEATNNSLERLYLFPPPLCPSITLPRFSKAVCNLQLLHVEQDPQGHMCMFSNESYYWDLNDIANIHSRVYLYQEGEINIRKTREHAKCPSRCCPTFSSVIETIVARNPGIMDLHILFGCHSAGFKPGCIFQGLGRLSSLVIKGLSLIDKRTLSFPSESLTNLRSLDIRNRISEFNLDPLWISMKRAGAQLEVLSTFQVSFHLCDFLATYSGLRKLIINGIEPHYEDSASERTTSIFYDSVLPKHSQSLKELELGFAGKWQQRGGWTFTLHKWTSILPSMTALTILRINPDGLDGLDGPDGDLFNYISPGGDLLLHEYQIKLEQSRELPKLTISKIVVLE